MMQEIVRCEFGRWSRWGFALVVAGLTSLGMCNILHPTSPSLILANLFTSFFMFVYLLPYAFGHLLRERQADHKTLTPAVD
jgi:hypothetical protein